eukprot:scaffold49323_cov44-Cyclotella_meneghiniana.AAC.1
MECFWIDLGIWNFTASQPFISLTISIMQGWTELRLDGDIKCDHQNMFGVMAFHSISTLLMSHCKYNEQSNKVEI